jgi:cell division protein FtsI (penicillin-binding protein 3)
MESGYYHRLARQEQTSKVSLPAVRGRIVAADGSVLALTVDTYTVVADPPQIPENQWQQVVGMLATDLGLPQAAVQAKLQSPTSRDYTRVAEHVPATIGDQIQQQMDSLQLPGITMEQSYARSYPDGSDTANLVGFTSIVNGSLIGKAGVEAAFDTLLAGHPGSQSVQTGIDGQQIPLAGSSVTPATPGRDVQLTIYPALQYEAQQACRQEVVKTHASNCSVVIMQPGTGRILAMAQWPTYDPANFASIDQTTDIPLQNAFEPGSTAKVITAAAAFEHGGQTPMSAYRIPYSITRGGQVIHDAEWSPGERLTIAGIIAHSSNIGMSQVAGHIPPALQHQYLQAFGLGQPTGLGLPGENPGTLLPLSQYWDSLPYTLSFGQGVDVNAVQMASVYATIANGGVRVRPTLIQSGTPQPSRRVIEAKTARTLIQILQQVPAFDTAGGQPWGDLPGYAIAAKTGTSQETGPNCPHTLCQYGASYIGIAPGDNPQLVVAVNVQNPRKGGYYGDIVAGPVFYQVMRFALATLKIPPDGAVAPWIRLTAP